METRKFVVASLLIVTALLPGRGFAYEVQTHAGLTQEVVKLFNVKFPSQAFGDDARSLMMQGSIDEDDEIRFMNHFYDPVYNRGLSSEETGVWTSSKTWANDVFLQSKKDRTFLGFGASLTQPTFSSKLDFTWDRAIYEYVHGDKSRAYLALGHVLHLLEDGSVPDHTRNDPHPAVGELGSPYEKYTSQFGPQNIAPIADTLLKQGTQPVQLDSLAAYFDKMAGYSNRNFFSRDTTPEKTNDYANPKIGSWRKEMVEGKELSYGVGEVDGQRFDMVNAVRALDTGKTSYQLDNPGSTILASYWSHLSPQAVLNGAGLLHLFFAEVEKEKTTGALLKRNTPLLKKAVDTIFNAPQAMLGSVYTAITVTHTAHTPPQPSSNLEEGVTVAKVGEAGTLSEAVAHTPSQPPPLQGEETVVIVKTADGDLATRELLAEILLKAARTAEGLQQAINRLSLAGQNAKSKTQNAGATVVIDLEASTTRKILLGLAVSGGGGGGGVPYVADVAKSNTQNAKSSDGDTPSSPPPSLGGGTTTPDTTAPNAPVVSSPLGSAFATTSLTFSGTAEATSTLAATFGATTTTTPVSIAGAWSLALTLPEGTTTIAFTATDAAGNVSATTTRTVSVTLPVPPLVAPTVSCSTSLATDGCFYYDNSGIASVGFTWTSAGDGASYTLKNGGDVLTTTSGLAATSSVTTGAITVVATRGDETVSSAAQPLTITNQIPLRLSELMWNGNLDLPNDEWIELKNMTAHTLDMSRFNLDMNADTLHLTGTASPDAYFLMERGDDNVITDETADMVYEGFQMPDEGAVITLRVGETELEHTPELLPLPRLNNTTDGSCRNSFPSGNATTGWCAGDVDGISMERTTFSGAADVGSSWDTNDGGHADVRHGFDRNHGDVYGTPKGPHLITSDVPDPV